MTDNTPPLAATNATVPAPVEQSGPCLSADASFLDAFHLLAADALNGRTHERLVIASASSAGRLLTWVEIDGDEAQTVFSRADKIAALSDPRGTILLLAHNHPSGNSEPSHCDIVATRRVALFAKRAGVRLVEHLIVAGDGHFSFAARGLL